MIHCDAVRLCNPPCHLAAKMVVMQDPMFSARIVLAERKLRGDDWLKLGCLPQTATSTGALLSDRNTIFVQRDGIVDKLVPDGPCSATVGNLLPSKILRIQIPHSFAHNPALATSTSLPR